MRTIALDFETAYAKGRDIRSMGMYAYVQSLDADEIYWMSVYDGRKAWSGPPKNFDWSALEDCRIVCHHAGFDTLVLSRLIELGVAPESLTGFESRTACSADLAAFCGYPRSLEGVSKELFGTSPDKSVRAYMLGKTYDSLDEENKKQFRKYAADDARICYDVWRKLKSKWSPFEHAVSRHTRMMGRRGIGVDVEYVMDAVNKASMALEECRGKIPWTIDVNAKPTSPLAFKAECRKAGVPTPATTAKNSENYLNWLETYGHAVPWALEVTRYRSINRVLRILELIAGRERDGRLSYELKYGAAQPTMRWGGSGRVNILNLAKAEVEGIDLRRCFRPLDKDHLFVIADIVSAEHIVSLHRARETDRMARIAQGVSPYQAYGEAINEWTPEQGNMKKLDPKLYLKLKGMVLGLGYGMGAMKYATIQKVAGRDLTLDEARKEVDEFRSTNHRLIAQWKKLYKEVAAYADKRHGYMKLPSGRKMTYNHPVLVDSELFEGAKELHVALARGGTEYTVYPMHPGKAMENYAQGTVRDLMSALVLDAENAGYNVAGHVHDEIILSVHRDKTQKALDWLKGWEAPDWTGDMPVMLEAQTSEHYLK